MNIIIVNPKSDFTYEDINRMEKIGKLTFIETSKYQDHPVFKSNEEKVLATGPELIDWKLPNKFIETVKNIKAICIPTTSFAWVDGAFLRSKNIDLLNAPKYSTESVAEYAISLMLNLAKKLPLIIKNGWKLDTSLHRGWEIKGKTMGIIGLGSIGTRIAEMGKAMGMHVIYWSRTARDNSFSYQELKDLMKQSDFIFPTLARNKDTVKIITKDLLNIMKKGSFLVSITGNDLFDVDYATELVNKGKLSGLAFESDKYTINNIKFNDFRGNILVTPPIAWYTQESFINDMKLWTENIISAVKGKPQNVVN
jgi:lactate dehydrogenase-like 2-hydroxyacid dehydrogenase